MRSLKLDYYSHQKYAEQNVIAIKRSIRLLFEA